MASKGENTLGRLNEVLFAELERLNALDASDAAALQAEVERSKASPLREFNGFMHALPMSQKT